MGYEVLPRAVGASMPKACLPTELLNDGNLCSVSQFSNSALLSEYPHLTIRKRERGDVLACSADKHTLVL